MISVETLANFILSQCDGITNKKLQKLCYYVYAWYLTVFQERIADIRFEAWAHGPVSPYIYNKYKKYGWDIIPKFYGFLPIDMDTTIFIRKILDYYSRFSADELEDMTHRENPWILARVGYKSYESSNELITDSSIIEYYTNSKMRAKIFS